MSCSACRSLFSIVVDALSFMHVYCNVSKSISVQMNESNAIIIIIIIIIIIDVRDDENAMARHKYINVVLIFLLFFLN